MSEPAAPTRPREARFEYHNFDKKPVYVEGAFGIQTPMNSLHVCFYSENLKPTMGREGQSATERDDGSGKLGLQVQAPDPYGLDSENITIVRNIEASLILTMPALQQIIPWLQGKLNEMQRGGSVDVPASGQSAG